MAFSEELWDKFDDICKRVHNGKTFTNTYSKFLKKHAEIESQYAKSLSRLCKDKVYCADLEFGTVKTAYNVYRDELEAISQKHEALAEQASQQSDVVTAYLLEAKKTRKLLFANGQKIIAELKKAEVAEAKASSNHVSLRRKNDDAEDEANKASGTKNEDKARKNAAAALKKAETADNEYKESVRLLQEAQRKFHQDVMPKVLDDLQNLEEGRVDSMRDWLTASSNAIDALPPAIALSAESMKNITQAIDKAADIATFIASVKSGAQRPPEAVYQPYVGGGGTPTRTASMANISSASSSSSLTSHSRQASTVSLNHSASTQSIGRMSLDGATKSKNVVQVVALYDYAATEETEISFSARSIITVLQKDDSGWWQGEIDGRVGLFPRNFVEEMPEKDQGKGASKVASPAPSSPASSAGTLSNTTTPSLMSPQSDVSDAGRCRALYDYQADSDSELTITEGEVLTIESEDEGWLFGFNQRGESGRFPSNYVEMLA